MIEAFLDEGTVKYDVPSIGWTCTYAPEEIFLAAGFQPFRISGTASSTQMADTCLHSNLCPYVKRCLEFGLQSKKPQLKGLVIAHSCNAMRIFYHYWNRLVSKGSFVHFLNVPKKTDAFAVDHFIHEIRGLKSALGNFFELTITNQSLWEAVELCNESRRMMAEINTMREEDRFPLKASELFHVARASQQMPRRDFSRQLNELMENLKT